MIPNTFKPMLVCNEEIDLSKVNYPMLASFKLDGIRCIFMDGKMLSRTLKPIPNKQLQVKFEPLKQYAKENHLILDGELYGHGLTFQEVTHFVMTEDLDDKKNLKKIGHSEVVPESLKFNCFDAIDLKAMAPQEKFSFEVRYKIVNELAKFNIVTVVKQLLVNSKEEVEALFEQALDEGYEGLILKKPSTWYKFGRTTFNSGEAYKVKPFKTFDAKIINIEERMENTSESYKNELGKSQKHNNKDAMIPTGIAGSFVVNFEGTEQKVNLTGTEEFRREVWVNRNKYIGKWIEFKGMTYGGVDKIRHPTFIRMRLDK